MANNAKVVEGQSKTVALSLDTVPIDILFEIVKKLPQSSYGPLAQTCSALRAYVQENGTALCNRQIKLVYPATLNRLNIEAHPSGWLVPFIEVPFKTYDQSSVKVSVVIKVPRHSIRGGITKVTKSITSPSKKSVILAGPQLLAFLDSHSLPIRGKFRQLVTNGGLPKKDRPKIQWKKWVGEHAILYFLKTGVLAKSMSWFYVLPGVKSYVQSEGTMDGVEFADRKDGNLIVASAQN
ncbi:hypothetical protein IFR05_001450 [Cadophora sp. M221]|nr:hypothetical protein IFR05_001450 [Cadophora sp. M221]